MGFPDSVDLTLHFLFKKKGSSAHSCVDDGRHHDYRALFEVGVYGRGENVLAHKGKCRREDGDEARDGGDPGRQTPLGPIVNGAEAQNGARAEPEDDGCRRHRLSCFG